MTNLPNNNVDGYNSSDNSTFDPIAQGEGQDHDDGKDECQAVRDLSQKDLEYRDLLAIFQTVRAVCGQASGSLIASKTLPAIMSVRRTVQFNGTSVLT